MVSVVYSRDSTIDVPSRGQCNQSEIQISIQCVSGELAMPVPEVGQAAPDFETLTDSGEKVKLSEFRGKRVVLYFYPKADTPGCTAQSCAFRNDYSAFQSKNAVIIGASPDTTEEQAAFKTKYNLPFTLLADIGHPIAEAYGAWQTFK